MSKYFNRAIIGNSKILACLDEKAELMRLYYPHIDYLQNVDTYKLGFVRNNKVNWFSDAELIKNSIEFENIDNCGLVIKYINKELIKPYSEFKIIINPSYKTTYYDLGDYYQVLYNEAGIMKDELYSQSLMINPLTLVIVVKK